MSAGVAANVIPRIARLYRFQWEPVQQRHVLLFPEGMVQLNGPAGEILQRCDGRRTVRAIIAELQQTFAVDGIEGDVLAFLEDAMAQGWIESGGTAP